MQTDNELIQAYHNGETEAFRELFLRHKGGVFNFSFRFLGNRAEAEDVTSEVFMQLFHKKFTPTGEAKLTTWLFTVARNACLSRLRISKNLVSFWSKNEKTDDYEEWEPVDTTDLAPEQIKKHEQASAVKRAIGKLPDEQKEAIILREYHDKNYSEIAEILGCSHEKVKILIFRAREGLRVELSHLIKEGQI